MYELSRSAETVMFDLRGLLEILRFHFHMKDITVETNYHLRREHDHDILHEKATEKGVAAIHKTLARLHHDAAGADPDILALTERSESASPMIAPAYKTKS